MYFVVDQQWGLSGVHKAPLHPSAQGDSSESFRNGWVPARGPRQVLSLRKRRQELHDTYQMELQEFPCSSRATGQHQPTYVAVQPNSLHHLCSLGCATPSQPKLTLMW